MGRLVFRRIKGPCQALEWDGKAARYVCGLVARPTHYLRWLPRFCAVGVRKLLLRWIAAGVGCDSTAEISEE